MKMSRTSKINTLVTAFSVLLTITLLLISLFFILIPHIESAFLKQKKVTIKELTDTAVSMLKTLHLQEESGKLTGDQAREAAILLIANLRYGPENKDYFWVIDKESRMIAHPFRPDLNGTQVDDFEDPKGKKIFLEMVDVVNKAGSGYVNYMWQWKDNPDLVVPKISYVEIFKPWGWIIGTGIYIEDIRAELGVIKKNILLGNIFILLLIILISLFIFIRTTMMEKQKSSAESALKEHLLKQEAILSAVPDPLILYDLEGKAAYVNNAFTRVFGWTSEELLGSKVDFVPPEEMERTIQGINDVYNSYSKHLVFESRRLTKNINIIDVIISAAVFKDTDGTPAGMVVNLTDITDRKTMEASLKESEEKFRSISNNALDGIIMINPQGKVTFFNRAAESMFGYSSAEVTGQDMHILFAPNRYHDDYTIGFSEFQETGQGNAIGKTLELSASRKDGGEFPVELSVSSMKLNGQWHAVGVLRDISLRKKAEKALKESEEYHRSLFEGSPMPLFLQDFSEVNLKLADLKNKGVTDFRSYLRDHPDETKQMLKSVKIIKTNQAALDLYKPPSPDALLSSLDNYVLSSGTEHFIDQVANFATGEFHYEGEVQNITYTGETVDLIVRKAVISGHEADLSRVMVSITDVTELNRAHSERERLETQLRQSQKMEALGTLAGGIAHDFNNILSALFGFTELALHKAKAKVNVENELDQILKSAARAKDLVKQILSFSRKTEQEKQYIRLSELVRDALKLLRATLPSTIELSLNILKEENHIFADPTQIHQVVMNLCTNSAHAMRGTGGIISIQIDEAEIIDTPAGMLDQINPGRYMLFSIVDSGQGIPPDIVDKIFDPYFTTKDIGQGTGLGLSVVHGIVANNGGGIKVRSVRDQGTTFTIYLPACREERDQDHQMDTDLVPSGKERILFVDDEHILRVVGRDLLEHLGYTVAVFESSLDALEYFKSSPRDIDLVITDQTMPGLTGMELAAEILAIRPEIPIIICTGYSEDLTREKALEAGIEDLMEKPVTMQKLAVKVREALDKARDQQYRADGSA